MVLGILVTLFRVPAERSKAMTVYATIANIGGSIGLVVGGVLIEYLSWHWIFFINLPIGVAGVAAASMVIPDDPGIGIRGGVDWKGGVLAVGAPTIGVWAIVNAARVGWFTVETVGLLVLAIGLGGLFFFVEGRVRNPLVPLSILRHRQLAAANSLRLFHGFGVSTVLFCGALYMQHVLRYTPLQTGFGYMALNVTIGFSSLIVVSRLIRRIGPVRPIIPGFLFVAAALLLLARSPFDGSYFADVLPSMLLVGVGASLVFLPSVTIAMTGAGPGEAGLASGLTNVTVQIGTAFGTALAASLAAIGTARALARHDSAAQALTSGYHLGFVVGLCGPLFGITIAAVFLRRAPRTLASESAPVEPALVAE
jgi:MFS family permease